MSSPPTFDDLFRVNFAELLRWRRDVRAFRSDPLFEDVLGRLLAQAARAPSVGNSQPSRFVIVRSAERRRALLAHVKAEQVAAGVEYDAERRSAYSRLKLHGLQNARWSSRSFAIPIPPKEQVWVARPCPKRLSIPLFARSIQCGSRQEPRESGWAGFLSFSPLRLLSCLTFRSTGILSACFALDIQDTRMICRSFTGRVGRPSCQLRRW